MDISYISYKKTTCILHFSTVLGDGAPTSSQTQAYTRVATDQGLSEGGLLWVKKVI